MPEIYPELRDREKWTGGTMLQCGNSTQFNRQHDQVTKPKRPTEYY